MRPIYFIQFISFCWLFVFDTVRRDKQYLPGSWPVVSSTMELQVPQNERTLFRIIIWSSTIAVAGSLALLFGFDNSGGQFRYHFTLASVLAFVVGLVLMIWFWKKVLTMLHDPKRTWRFIIISSVVMVIAFIGCIFLPQFRPMGSNTSDLLQGMILGFLAVAAVFYLAAKVMRLMEKADDAADAARKDHQP